MKPSTFISSALLLASASGVSALPFGLSFKWPWESRVATVCNGRSELCNRPYGNVTFLGAHNSYAFSPIVLALARTQEVSPAEQLKLGVRLLQGQTHMKDGKLNLCHTTCGLFDGGTLENYLRGVKKFLDANPNEVLTLIITNPEKVSLVDHWKPAFDNSGMTPLVFVPDGRPTKRDDWPTLGSMIDSGKRVVVFLDTGAGDTVPWLLPEFDYLWENPFSVTDPNFPCRVDRIGGPLSPQEHMYLINHVLNVNLIPIGDGVLVSDFANAPKTNKLDSIIRDSNGCARFADGKAPNFVLMDYVNIGDGKKAVDHLNGF